MKSKSRARPKAAPAPGLWSRVANWARSGLVGDGDVAVDEEEEDLEAPAPRTPRQERIQEIKGILLIAGSLWLCLALATYFYPPWDPKAAGFNWCGKFGFYFADLIYSAGGLAGLLLPVLGGAWGAVLVARKCVRLPAVRIVAALCLMFAVAYLLEIAFGGPDARSNRLRYGPGGWLALSSTPDLQLKFGGPGLLILMTCLALVSFLLATEMAFFPALAALGRWLTRRRTERNEGSFSAITGWMGRLVLGLWDFVRGAKIGASAEQILAGEAQAA